MSEINLIKCWQDGDMDSFRALYECYSSPAIRTAFLITGRRDIAEDVVQDAFIQSNNNINKLRDPEKFRSWFYRILVRLSWQYSSKEKGKVPFEDVSFMAESEAINTAEILEHYEMKRTLHEAVSKLSTPLKTVVVLYYFNELTVKEIAGVLNCFEGTVKSRLHNARKFLEKELRNDDIAKELYFRQVKGV